MNFVGKGVVLAGFVKQKIQLGRMLRSFRKRPEKKIRSKGFDMSNIIEKQ